MGSPAQATSSIASPSPPSQIEAIHEMLERLETVTRAGQQHIMAKIVAMLVAHPAIAAGGPVVAACIEDLRREARKAAPDGGAFARATRALFSATRVRR